MKPWITLQPFNPNVYYGATGNIYKSLDIIRIIISIFVILISIHNFLSSKRKLHIKEKSMKKYIMLLIQPKVSFAIFVAALFLFSFVFKIISLNNSLDSYFESNILSNYSISNEIVNFYVKLDLLQRSPKF